jgi:hypothetical protein
MDFVRILAELRQEKEAIEQAILSIERLAGAHERGSLSGAGVEMPRKRGRPKGSKNRSASHPAATNGAGGQAI